MTKAYFVKFFGFLDQVTNRPFLKKILLLKYLANYLFHFTALIFFSIIGSPRYVILFTYIFLASTGIYACRYKLYHYHLYLRVVKLKAFRLVGCLYTEIIQFSSFEFDDSHSAFLE